jgi:hypothetical protein
LKIIKIIIHLNYKHSRAIPFYKIVESAKAMVQISKSAKAALITIKSELSSEGAQVDSPHHIPPARLTFNYVYITELTAALCCQFRPAGGVRVTGFIIY